MPLRFNHSTSDVQSGGGVEFLPHRIESRLWGGMAAEDESVGRGVESFPLCQKHRFVLCELQSQSPTTTPTAMWLSPEEFPVVLGAIKYVH